jgi:hypothetical protein
MLIRLPFLRVSASGISSFPALVLGSLIVVITCSARAGESPPGPAETKTPQVKQPAQVPSQPSEAVWGALLYASNDRAPEKAETQIPARIRNYDERLEKMLGYASIQTLGQGQTRIEPNNSGSIVFHGSIRIELTGFARRPRDRFLVGLRLFHGEHQLIETQAEVTRGSPLFIRGPLWREGQLVVAVMVTS